MIEALVFDLDDTLYPESDFVASGYRAVALHVSECYGRPYDEVISAMMTAFSTSGRAGVLPMAIERFTKSAATLEELVAVYRGHTPGIKLLPGYLDLLRDFRRQYRLGLITDGTPEVQRRKVRVLGLESVMHSTVYTWDLGKDYEKPNPRGFELMLQELKTDAAKTVFVGDNPEKDGKGARNIGMGFVQVLLPRGDGLDERTRQAGTAEFTIRSLMELPQILKRMAGDEQQ